MPKHQEQWEKLGQTDPYFGVLSTAEYRSAGFDETKKSKFYASGEQHIDRLLAFVHELYGERTMGRALDFGCGVGRLVTPLAGRFDEAVGIDISNAMIDRARARAHEVGAGNVGFYNHVEDVPGTFDFVHSYIVFQHIPVRIGLGIIEALADRLRDGGVLALHLVLVMDRPKLRLWQHEIRKRVALWHYAINVVSGLKWDEPLQEMNAYPLNTVLYALFKRDVGRAQVVTALSTEFGPKIFSGYLIAAKNDPLGRRIDF